MKTKHARSQRTRKNLMKNLEKEWKKRSQKKNKLISNLQTWRKLVSDLARMDKKLSNFWQHGADWGTISKEG